MAEAAAPTSSSSLEDSSLGSKLHLQLHIWVRGTRQFVYYKRAPVQACVAGVLVLARQHSFRYTSRIEAFWVPLHCLLILPIQSSTVPSPISYHACDFIVVRLGLTANAEVGCGCDSEAKSQLPNDDIVADEPTRVSA